MQPVEGKNSTKFWDKINHATSLDKQKSCNLSGQKNHETSWDKKKVTQPLGTIKSHNLSEEKNHATSWDTKKNKKTKIINKYKTA